MNREANTDETGTQHVLKREIRVHKEQVWDFDKCGNLTHQGEGTTFDVEEMATIECSCGQRFRKERTAAEHLRKVRGDSQ